MSWQKRYAQPIIQLLEQSGSLTNRLSVPYRAQQPEQEQILRSPVILSLLHIRLYLCRHSVKLASFQTVAARFFFHGSLARPERTQCICLMKKYQPKKPSNSV